MTWRPLHSNHAIERVRLVIQFKGQIPAKLSRRMRETLEPKRNDLRMAGPSPVQSIAFQIGPGMATPLPQAQNAEGWQFSRNASNGLPIEAFVCDVETLTYETTEYQRWDVYKRRLGKIINQMMEIASEALDLQSVSLEYVDRFVFEGAMKEADCTLLFNDLVKVVNSDAVKGESPWHLHRGWFEAVAHGRVLVNQNIDIHEGVVPGRSSALRSALVTTRAEYRDPFFSPKAERFAQHLDELHDLTKSYFMSAVQQGHHSSVGIHNGS